IDLLSNPKDESEPDRIEFGENEIRPISCISGDGIDSLLKELSRTIEERLPDLTSGLVVTSARHRGKLIDANEAMARAIELTKSGETPELLTVELKSACTALEEITGRIYNEEILESIFSSFCIGK
ncbi:MAG: hypothetical protein V3T31_11165, partial [candidate division Zixibacteria bacterium]